MLSPTASAPPEELADWLELKALRSADKNSSLQDLVRALRRSGTTDALVDDVDDDDGTAYASDPRSEKSQTAAEDAFSEVEERRTACAATSELSLYPFAVEDAYITADAGAQHNIYLFLLLLSACGKDAGPDDMNGEALFEDLCAEALKAYFGGDPQADAVVFGFPRLVLPAGFRDAVNDLCDKVGEGGTCRDRPTRKDQKDAKLDIVAWRSFSDGRSGKLIGFGQCATGSNWRDKLTELLPDNFCDMWLTEPLAVKPVRAFFVPYRIEKSRWLGTCVAAGIVFDRCRIAGSLHSPSEELVSRCEAWVDHVLKGSTAKRRKKKKRSSRGHK